MGCIGIIVDGQYDEEVIRVLVKRQYPKRKLKTIKALQQRNYTKIISLMDANIGDVDGFIWVTDAEQEDPEELKNRMENEVGKNRKRISRPVQCVVVVRMLEAWLLADHAALEKELNISVKEIPNPEELQHPKNELESLFRKVNKIYTKEAAKRIAEKLDMDRVREKCPSFAQFMSALSTLAD